MPVNQPTPEEDLEFFKEKILEADGVVPEEPADDKPVEPEDEEATTDEPEEPEVPEKLDDVAPTPTPKVTKPSRGFDDRVY